jgi:hypothetical protein
MIPDSEIANMAISQLGAKMSVTNFVLDQSNEAKAVRVYYDDAVRGVLADAPWPFASVFQKLNLVSWFFSHERQFAYLYPTNCSKIVRLFSPRGYNRNDDVQSRQKTKIIRAANPGPITYIDGIPQPPTPQPQPQQFVKLILADEPDLWCEYTQLDMNAADYDADFRMALAFKLAWLMAPRLTGGDPFKFGAAAQANYFQALRTAAAHALNEENDDEVRAGEFIDERMGGDGHHRGAGPWQAFPTSTFVG